MTMTTPRDALAAALNNDALWMHHEDAERLIAALAAVGWVLVPDPAPTYDGSMSKPAIDAHSPDPAPLDVERLARCIKPALNATGYGNPKRFAAAIAREYANVVSSEELPGGDYVGSPSSGDAVVHPFWTTTSTANETTT